MRHSAFEDGRSDEVTYKLGLEGQGARCEGVGESPFQAEGAAGARAAEQTGAGVFGNRKSGIGQGQGHH